MQATVFAGYASMLHGYASMLHGSQIKYDLLMVRYITIKVIQTYLSGLNNYLFMFMLVFIYKLLNII